MKRIISFILALTIVFSACVVNVYANSENTEYDNLNIAELLYNLGIVSDSDTGALNNGLTRGEFSLMLAKVFAPGGITSQNIYFKDVPSSCPYAKGIAALVEIGVLKGDSDGMFYPYNEITVGECSKMAVAALNRDLYKDDKNAYPGKYIAYAVKLDLFDGVSSNAETLTVSDGYTVMYNILNAKPAVYTGSDWVVSNNNVMCEYLGVYKYSGIVTDNGNTGILGETKLNAGKIRVEDKNNGYMDFVLADDTQNPYLGYDVDVYYEHSKSDGNDYALSVVATSENTVQTVNGADNLTFDGNYIHWDESMSQDVLSNVSKENKMRVDGDLTVIVNGSFTGNTSDVLSKINDAQAGKYNIEKIVALSNDGNSVPDILFVEMYFNLTAGIINATEEFIVDKFEGGLIDFGSNYKDIKTNYYDSEGNPTNFNAVTKNDVLSVKEYGTADNPCADIYIYSKNIVGTLSKKDSELGLYTVAGKEYKASNGIKTKLDGIKVGKTVAIYLDFMGRIGGVNITQDSDMFTGFVITLNIDNGMFTKDCDRMELKIYRSDMSLENWSVENYNVNNLRIDGKKVDSATLEKIKSKEIVYGKMINFKLDGDGKITHIYTVGKFDDTNAVLRAPNGLSDTPVKMVYKMDSNTMYENGTLNAMTVYKSKVIGVPSNSVTAERDRYCSVLKAENVDVLSGLSYNVTGVIYSEDGIAAELMVVYRDTGLSIEDIKSYGARYEYIAVVREVSDVLKENGEYAKQISGMMNEKTVTLVSAGTSFTDENGNAVDVNTGDMLLVTYNPLKEVSAVRKIYDAKADAYCSISKSAAYQNERMLIGKVFMSNPSGNYLSSILVCERDDALELENCQAINIQHSQMRKYILDTTLRTPTLRRAYGWDFIPYHNAEGNNGDGSKVVIYLNNSTAQAILIIK